MRLDARSRKNPTAVCAAMGSKMLNADLRSGCEQTLLRWECTEDCLGVKPLASRPTGRMQKWSRPSAFDTILD